MSFYTNNYSHQQSNIIRIPLAPKKDFKGFSQDNYLNEDASNALFFSQYLDGDNRSKSSSYFNSENETRSSILASTSFEFDQVIEDNQSNLLELEDLSRANSEYVQSSMNNYNSFSPNSDFLSNEQEYNDNRYMEYYQDKNQMMAPIAEQYNKEQDNSFVFEDGRKDYAYFSNDNFEQANNYEFNEHIVNYPSNLECNQQFQCNAQLKTINRNLQDVQHDNQMQQQHYSQQYESRCESDNCNVKQFYQPQFNQGYPQKLIHESVYINQPYIPHQIDNVSYKNSQIQNVEITSQNSNSYNNPNATKQIQSSQTVSNENKNTQKDSVISEFSNMVSSSVENGFNYYQYYKTYQENGSPIFNDESNSSNQCSKTSVFENVSCASQFIIENQSSEFGYNSSELMNNRNIVNCQNTLFYQKDPAESKEDQKEKKEMEKNDLSKLESMEDKSDEQLDEDDTVMAQLKEENSPAKKLSIDIHTSTSAALMNDEEPAAHPQKDGEETLQKIDEMKMCNKKNVVKNIMNAYKNFILEAELKNTPKVNQTIVNLYNNAKSEEIDSLPEIIKKFKRYINSKNFNHYSMRLLILHPNYGPVLQYFLKGPIYEWAKTCKANDLASHFVMVDFLLLSFSDIKYIDELKRHEKKKAHYQ